VPHKTRKVAYIDIYGYASVLGKCHRDHISAKFEDHAAIYTAQLSSEHYMIL